MRYFFELMMKKMNAQCIRKKFTRSVRLYVVYTKVYLEYHPQLLKNTILDLYDELCATRAAAHFGQELNPRVNSSQNI